MILTLRLGDQLRDLILRNHLAPLLRDLSMRAVNRVEAERQRKAKEDKRKKRQRKLLAWEREEDTDSNDDDDEEHDDEVVADTEWDDLESKDMLTGICSSF